MAWIETFVEWEDLDAVGVHIGSKAVVARHRKVPLVLGEHVGAYGLDDKAALVILFDILDQLGDEETAAEVVFAVTASEEVGVAGAAWLAAHRPADVMIALEVAPVAEEYMVLCDERPVVLMQDAWNVYDERIARELATAAANLGIGLQHQVVCGFGSDSSICARLGHVARAACVGFPTANTHGYELTHLGALLNTARLIAEWLRSFG